MESVIEFKVGDTFPSFAGLNKQIESYSNQHHVPMTISDCRTLASAVSTKRTVKEIIEERRNFCTIAVSELCVETLAYTSGAYISDLYRSAPSAFGKSQCFSKDFTRV